MKRKLDVDSPREARAEKKAAATKGLPLQFRKLSTKPVKKAKR